MLFPDTCASLQVQTLTLLHLNDVLFSYRKYCQVYEDIKLLPQKYLKCVVNENKTKTQNPA